MTLSRRDLLLGSAGLAGAAGPAASAPSRPSRKAPPELQARAGASLRVLRWTPFVKGDEDAWLANTKKFTEATGVEVRVDKESWEDIRPKAAVAANVGSGPDIMLVWFDDPFQYPDKLLDVTDIATASPAATAAIIRASRATPRRTTSSSPCRSRPSATASSTAKACSSRPASRSFPKRRDAFLEMCKALKAKIKPAGFALGKAVGDGNNFAHWIVWSHGGKMVDEGGKVVINSPETIKALQYARELYQTFIPGTESWLDINNNRVFLSGDVSVTANGVSLYYSAKNDPKMADIAKDIRSADPAGRAGRPAGRAAPDDLGA